MINKDNFIKTKGGINRYNLRLRKGGCFLWNKSFCEKNGITGMKSYDIYASKHDSNVILFELYKGSRGSYKINVTPAGVRRGTVRNFVKDNPSSLGCYNLKEKQEDGSSLFMLFERIKEDK